MVRRKQTQLGWQLLWEADTTHIPAALSGATAASTWVGGGSLLSLQVGKLRLRVEAAPRLSLRPDSAEPQREEGYLLL